MIKISINKILWHVVRFECLVGIEILKYEFWPFLQKPGKKCKTAITFAEKSEFDFTGVYPVSNSQIPQIPKEKKVISNRRFFSTKSKKIQEKNLKKKKIQKFIKSKKSYNKEDCWNFWIFWIFLNF